MMAGCVPVVCSDHYALPYPSQIDWDATVLRVPEAGCTRFLQVLPRFSPMKWSDMHRSVLHARTLLTYLTTAPAAKGYVVDGMIREMQRMISGTNSTVEAECMQESPPMNAVNVIGPGVNASWRPTKAQIMAVCGRRWPDKNVDHCRQGLDRYPQCAGERVPKPRTCVKQFEARDRGFRI